MAKFKDTKMCPKCCAIFFLNECPVCALEKRIDAHLIELIRTPIWTATPHKDFESLDEFLAESDEDLPNHMTRCPHGNAVSETVVCEACDSDEPETSRCPEGPHTGDQCGSMPAATDEEWKAVYAEVATELVMFVPHHWDYSNPYLVAAAKLVVQERASRKSWAERARLMEDERNQERKRSDDMASEYDTVRRAHDEVFDQAFELRNERDEARETIQDMLEALGESRANGPSRQGCVQAAERVKSERNRLKDAFEELVDQLRGDRDFRSIADWISFVDALEKKARGE